MDLDLTSFPSLPQASATDGLHRRRGPKIKPVGRIHRLLIISSHPVPYSAPLYRLMASQKEMDIQVAYCSMGPEWDSGFGRKVVWDVPLLEEYPWVQIRNWALRPGLGHFFGLVNPGILKLISSKQFDAVAVPGYAYFSFWVAFLAAKITGVQILLETDATTLRHPSGGWWWKRWLKKPLVRFIYSRVADIVLVPSTASKEFLDHIGVPDKKIVLAPYTVDNDYFARGKSVIDPQQVRRDLALPKNSFVILFCGKLVRWKRPEDVLRSLAILDRYPGAAQRLPYVLMAGDGPLRRKLQLMAESLGIGDRVRFLGFVNQSKLPEVYAASDVLVLPSESEAWGVVVNEAMSSGVPAIVSDRVGSRLDLIYPGLTGEVYPAGDVEALASCLRKPLCHPQLARRMGIAARERISTWSYRENVEAWIKALKVARASKILNHNSRYTEDEVYPGNIAGARGWDSDSRAGLPSADGER